MKNYADDGFPRYQRTRNDLPGCRMTDRPTEQIHQPEQLTNISFSNLMAVGNILEEYSFVCWAGGRYALIYAIPLFHTFFFLQWLQLWKQFLKLHCKCFVKQKFRTRVICYFVIVYVFQPVFKDLEAQFKEQTEEFETTKKSIVGKKVACVQLLFQLLFAGKGCMQRKKHETSARRLVRMQLHITDFKV